MHFDVVLFESKLFGILCASWICMSISSSKLGKLSFIIFSSKFSISCSYSHSGIPMIQMLTRLEMHHSLLIQSSFFWILVSSFYSGWMFLSSLCSKLLVFTLASLPSWLVPCEFFFIPLSITFISSFMLFHIQWVLQATRSPVFWTLHLIGWLHFSSVIFLGVFSVPSLGPHFFFSWCW